MAKNVSVYVPLIKLKDMDCASERMPVITDVAPLPELEMFTTGVPVTVRFVAVAVVQRVPPALLLTVMLPEPKAIVRTPDPLELKEEQVKVFPARLNVPLLKVVVPTDTGPPKLRGLVTRSKFEVMTFLSVPFDPAVVEPIPLTTLIELKLPSKVPLVIVKPLPVAKINASASCHVPPIPLNVIGVFRVAPLEVINFVPDVAANVSIPVADGIVIKPESVRLP